MTGTTEQTLMEQVGDLLAAELGERWGDGYTVTDVVHGYAQPGYGSDDAVIVLGNWNPKRWPRDGEPELTDAENVGPRLAELLEEMGAEIEWCDEWVRCGECYRIFRSSPDSYMWTMFGAYVEDAADYICADCLRSDVDACLDDYIDNPDNAVTWASPADMSAGGWTQYAPDDPREYESGWHPGQTDDPRRVLDSIRDDMGANVKVVFLINSVGQFDTRWSAWTRGGVPPRGECTYDDDSEWCNGGCITHPHKWNAGGRCTRTGCDVAGTGDACNDGNCEGHD